MSAIAQINAHNTAYADGYAEHIQHGWGAVNPYRPFSSLGVSWRRGRMSAIRDLATDDRGAVYDQVEDINRQMRFSADKALAE